MNIAERLLRVEDVAELLQLSIGTVYHLISQKRIPCVRLSARCVRFRRDDIEAWLEQRAVQPSQEKGERNQTKRNQREKVVSKVA